MIHSGLGYYPTLGGFTMRRLAFISIVLSFVVATTAMAQSLSGAYRFVQDSTGKQAKDNAAIDITFKPGGTFTFKAAMPGQTVDDTGTYRISGQTLTIDFKELEQGHQSGAYSISGETLTLPFKMLSSGAGSSTWRLVAATPPSTPAAAAPAVGASAAGPVPEILARTLKDAQGGDNARQRGDIDQRTAARAAAYRGGAAQAYYVQGSILFLKRYHKEAWYAFAKASSLEPQNAVYLNNLAMVLLELGRLPDARGILDWVVKNYPNLDPPWGNLGAACLKLRDAACALAAFQRASTLAPENGLYFYGYGKALEAQGRGGDAKSYYAQAFQKGYGGSGKEGASAADASGGTAAGTTSAATAQSSGKQSGAATARKDKIPDAWVGRYQARFVRATSGMDRDNKTAFGKGMTQTTMDLKTMACVQQFSLDVAASGAIEGRGRIMYVYQGTAANPIAKLAPGMVAGGPGGFAANLKDGKQFRDWSFTGRVSPDGAVEINGIPDEAMDLLNVGKWEKHRPWSPLPPDGPGKAMRGPFHMTLSSEGGGPPAIRVDQFLAIGDALIKRVHYQAYIFKSDTPVAPDCAAAETPKPAKCPASQYLKVKNSIGVDGIYTIETSKDLKAGKTFKDMTAGEGTVTSKAGGGEVTGGYSTDSDGNMSIEGNWGSIVGSQQYNTTDGSYQVTVGVGIDSGKILPGPAKLSEKIELVYDSACGWGIKGTAGINASVIGGGVEGAIYFNKGV
jgi:Flp pilus assembly protein TadD